MNFSRNFKHVNNIYFDDPMLVREDEHGRFYMFPGFGEAPSVTTVIGHKLSEGLQEWQDRVGKDYADIIKNQAAQRGETLHGVCETYLRNFPINKLRTPPLAFRLFRQLQPFLNRIDTVHCVERCLYGTFKITKPNKSWTTFPIAGRVDCIAEFDRKVSVIDFKTASRPKQEAWIENYFLQATCYAEMWNASCTEDELISQIVVMIAVVNGDQPQIFIRDTAAYIKPLYTRLEEYHAFQKTRLSSLAKPSAISA